MPFIDSKTTCPISSEKRETIKTELGQAVALLSKSEQWLMVGFEDQYDLYMAGNKTAPSAFIKISLYGTASSDACEKMTAKVTDIFHRELSIPSERIYITYEFVDTWGWNGNNF